MVCSKGMGREQALQTDNGVYPAASGTGVFLLLEFCVRRNLYYSTYLAYGLGARLCRLGDR